MSEQYYCLHLDDYSTPAFISYGKSYYGTLEDLKAFIDTLDEAEETHERFESLPRRNDGRVWEQRQCGLARKGP